MTKKALVYFILIIILLAACQPDLDIVTVTARPILTAVSLATDTAVPPTITATSTAVPPTPYPTVTSEPTVTVTPSPTATPAPPLPSASVLFVRDDALQQWIPQTGEVKTLVENVTRFIFYSADFTVFHREITPDEEYALIVFHIPTQSEYELLRTSTTPLLGFGVYDSSISVSPNGRWLAYISGDSRDSVTLMVHEITVEDQQVTVSSPVLTVVPGAGWNWPYDQLTWPTENEISWNDQAGIWVADLTTNPIAPSVVIAPSTNSFQVGSMNPADQDKGPFTVDTIFVPYLWSADGRYLLAVEIFPGETHSSIFRVIERNTNKYFEIPESAIGAVSDGAIWLDKTTMLHYRASGDLRIWKIDAENDPMASLQEIIPAMGIGYVEVLWLSGNHLRVSNYDRLIDLNLETGEVQELLQDLSRPLYWTPDGQHILWSDMKYVNDERQAHVFLADLNGDEPEEMDSVFGLDSCCWHWYEE